VHTPESRAQIVPIGAVRISPLVDALCKMLHPKSIRPREAIVASRACVLELVVARSLDFVGWVPFRWGIDAADGGEGAFLAPCRPGAAIVLCGWLPGSVDEIEVEVEAIARKRRVQWSLVFAGRLRKLLKPARVGRLVRVLVGPVHLRRGILFQILGTQ